MRKGTRYQQFRGYFLYALSHRQDSTFHGFICCGELAETSRSCMKNVLLRERERERERGWEKMFYLTTHSTHFIYGYIASDHSDSERGNPLPFYMGYSFRLAEIDRIAHTMAFVAPVVEHGLEREIAHWVHHKGKI